MYALLQVAGKQFRVRQDDVIRVPRLADEVGQAIEIKEVLAMGQGEDLQVGRPFVDDASVQAEVVAHGRGRKIHIFKMKRRKKYRRHMGHRQDYTDLKITSLG